MDKLATGRSTATVAMIVTCKIYEYDKVLGTLLFLASAVCFYVEQKSNL